jgi:hypothetical protein
MTRRIYNVVFILCLLLWTFSGISQNGKVLRGVIKDYATNIPVADLRVSADGVASYTNEFGQYNLDLENSPYTPGDLVTIYTDNPEYGSQTIKFILGKEYRHDFSIRKNLKTKYIAGVIKDRKTKEPIQDLTITVELDGVRLDVKETKTDKFGRFGLEVDKVRLGDNSLVRPLIHDPQKIYSSGDGLLASINVNAFNIIYVDAKGKSDVPPSDPAPNTIEKDITVSSQQTFYSNIEVGDSIIIRANGQVCLGPLAGCHGPGGRTGYVDKSYFPQANHGSLLCRIGNGEWFVLGSYKAGRATQKGDLQFLVNDKDDWNNSGAFNVNITIVKGR